MTKKIYLYYFDDCRGIDVVETTAELHDNTYYITDYNILFNKDNVEKRIDLYTSVCVFPSFKYSKKNLDKFKKEYLNKINYEISKLQYQINAYKDTIKIINSQYKNFKK